MKRTISTFGMGTLLVFCCILLCFTCCDKAKLPPAVESVSVSDVGSDFALCTGKILDEGDGKILEKGICWAQHDHPSVYDVKAPCEGKEDEFSYNLTGLLPFSTYWVRAYATNKQGTAYGATIKFCTKKAPGPTGTDVDGNLYHSVQIGTQIWMLENLKVLHFRNGDSIPFVTNSIAWPFAVPRVCYYNNNDSYKDDYGCLYNWYAVNDTRGLAPEGWHIPSREEWQVLVDYIGGEYCGGKLKEAGYDHWLYPNEEATNETVFTALPGGYRDLNGTYEGPLGSICFMWSNSEAPFESVWVRLLTCSSGQYQEGYNDKCNGFSVRCIKNN